MRRLVKALVTTVAGMVTLGFVLAAGLYIWLAVKFDLAEGRAENEAESAASAIAQELRAARTARGVESIVRRNSGELIRQERRVDVLVVFANIHKKYAGLLGASGISQCYEFTVPAARPAEVTYEQAEPGQCVPPLPTAPPSSARPTTSR